MSCLFVFCISVIDEEYTYWIIIDYYIAGFFFEELHIVVFIHGDDELHTIYRVLLITEILWFIYVYMFTTL